MVSGERDNVSIAGLLEEVTELRHALAAAQARAGLPPDVDRAAWLTSILAHTPDVISILDPAGTMLYLNRAPVGVDVEDALGHSIGPHLVEPHRTAWQAALARALATGKPQQLVILTSTEQWWDVRLVPLEQDGRAYILSLGKDISSQRQIEIALERKDQQLRLALEASGMGQWWWNIAADAVTWDERTKRIFDWPLDRDDISYASFLARVHADDRERVTEHVARARATRVYAPLESRIVLPDGTTKWILMTGRVLSGPDGAPTDLLGGIVDITAQKQREAQVRRQQKLEAIGQLAGGIAHDFNNLLVAITGNLALARRAHDGAHRDELIGEALAASDRAADLTRQLLAFSRRQQIREAVLDLREVLDDTLQLLRRLLPATIVIEVAHGADVPPVRGDRGQLEQVIVNLCVNARDAMPDGGRLELRTCAIALDGGAAGARAHAALVVRDTGSGIPASLLERIFDPFFTTKDHGTGLGLATAYGIAKQHGGVLEVESEVGAGTTFTLCLPGVAGFADEATPPPAPAVRGGDERVLLAEDEPAVRSIVTRILEDSGYRVHAVADGQAAVDVVTADTAAFDLVLLDAVMPRLGGVEAVARIRALAPGVPIILSSGYSTMLVTDPAVAGELAYLPKPYEPDALLGAVRRALDARRA